MDGNKWLLKRFGIMDEKYYFSTFPVKIKPPYRYLKSHMLEAFHTGKKLAEKEINEKSTELIKLLETVL